MSSKSWRSAYFPPSSPVILAIAWATTLAISERVIGLVLSTAWSVRPARTSFLMAS